MLRICCLVFVLSEGLGPGQRTGCLHVEAFDYVNVAETFAGAGPQTPPPQADHLVDPLDTRTLLCWTTANLFLEQLLQGPAYPSEYYVLRGNAPRMAH